MELCGGTLDQMHVWLLCSFQWCKTVEIFGCAWKVLRSWPHLREIL